MYKNKINGELFSSKFKGISLKRSPFKELCDAIKKLVLIHQEIGTAQMCQHETGESCDICHFFEDYQ